MYWGKVVVRTRDKRGGHCEMCWVKFSCRNTRKERRTLSFAWVSLVVENLGNRGCCEPF